MPGRGLGRPMDSGTGADGCQGRGCLRGTLPVDGARSPFFGSAYGDRVGGRASPVVEAVARRPETREVMSRPEEEVERESFSLHTAVAYYAKVVAQLAHERDVFRL